MQGSRGEVEPGAPAFSAVRPANWFAMVMLGLVAADRVTDNVESLHYPELPFTVALFVLPVLYVYPRTRPLLARYAWAVLAAQAVLTWVPLAIFGSQWQWGIGGLLAALVLLLVPGRRAWALAGLLLSAEFAARAALGGYHFGFAAPGWFNQMSAVLYYVDDCVALFAPVRLAQLVEEIEDARDLLAEAAVSAERLQVARSLQAAVGERIALVTSCAAQARQDLNRDQANARNRIEAAGAAARDAAVRMRALSTGRLDPSRSGSAVTSPVRSVMGARLAWTVLVLTLCAYSAEGVGEAAVFHYGMRLMVFVFADTVLCVALLLYHVRFARDGVKPRGWPLTLTMQALLAFAFALPFVAAFTGFAGMFLASSVLLLLPRWWRWAGFAVAIACYSVLLNVLPALHAVVVGSSPVVSAIFNTVALTATVGLLVYGLTWLAGLAVRLEGLQAELARTAVLRERLRVARDVHDLLGLGLATAALKADLVGRLIGHDDARADAEIEAMARVCAATRADIRLVTGDGQLSLAAELDADRDILASAGIDVTALLPGGTLPGAADVVLAPVLREAVTNVLRHSTATACVIEVVPGDAETVWLRVRNDGVPDEPSGTGTGRGLANLSSRVRAAGGQLTCEQAEGWYSLAAGIPVPGWAARGQPPYSQPASAAMRTASTRLRALSLVMAEAR